MARARRWAERAGTVVDEIDAYPALIAWADMPRLGDWHIEAPLADLREGADAAVGATLDGGVYLVALAAPQSRLLDALPMAAHVLAAAAELELEIGLLRPERALRSEDDRRALLADPLLAPEVRRALSERP